MIIDPMLLTPLFYFLYKESQAVLRERKTKGTDEPNANSGDVVPTNEVPKMTQEHRPKVFSSYSWTGKAQAKALADALITQGGVDVVIDVYDLKPGMDIHAFMRQITTDESFTHVIMLCDKVYTRKANALEGGVGIETNIISPRIYKSAKQTKFIPLALEMDETGNAYLPAMVETRLYINFSAIDFTKDFNKTEAFEELLRTLWAKPKEQKPPLGPCPFVNG